MKILLDTHCWLWWMAEPGRLSTSARALIAERENTIVLSAASSWEIAIKYALGKLNLPESPEIFVPKRIARDSLTSLSIQHVHALRVATLPPYHSDPFDRLLVAQAQIEHLPILTANRQFELYDVELIWADRED